MEFSISVSLATILVAYLIYSISTRIYNVFFHPVAKFPGPWYRAAFAFPFHWEQLKGIAPTNIHALHQKYGPVVRIAPDMLSFSRSGAWKDIYGFRQGKRQIPKDYKRFPDIPDFLPLFTSNDTDHTRIRKLVAHAFSETALREQEPLVQEHIRGFINQLCTNPECSSRVNLDLWLDRLSFDVLSDLTFCESFDGVNTGTTHDYIKRCYIGCNMTPVMAMAWDYDAVKYALQLMFNLPSVKIAQDGDKVTVQSKVDRRIALKDDTRKDFMTYILRFNDERGVSRSEMEGLTTLFMAAGGEEPASLIAGVLWYLLKHPKDLKTAQDEIDQSLETAEDINGIELAKLPFFNAIIKETARIRPPGSGHFSRRTDRQEIIDGHTIPSGISVEVSQYAASHDPFNFAEPETWAPERWMSEPPGQFVNDDRDASQPFGVGPRQCLGKNLATLLVRSTLAQILWTFDITLCDESQDWFTKQKFRAVWHRPGLFVRLAPRK